MRPEVTICASFASRRAFIGLGLGAVAAGFAIWPRAALAGHDGQSAPAAGVAYMTPDAAHTAALAGEIILIDIRRPDEWLETRVGEGAVGLDMRADDFVQSLVTLRQANPDTPIALICRTGARSGYVTTTLAQQGFPGLVDVNEGMIGNAAGPGWLKRGLPTYEGTPENIARQRRNLFP